MIKKFFVGILALITLMCTIFSGCSHESGKVELKDRSSHETPTLKVFLDTNRTIPEKEIMSWLKDIPGYGEDFNVAITSTPEISITSNGDHEAVTQHERVELIAGEGADVFICECTKGLDTEIISKGVFPYPEAAMDLGYFLPLDDFIENASFMELDKMNSQVMAAGKSKQSQLIIPATFSIYATLFEKNKYSLPEEQPLSWEDQFNSEDLGMQLASLGAADTLSGRFAPTIDYEKDTLLISKEELQRYVESSLEVDISEMLAAKDSLGLVALDVMISPEKTSEFPDKVSREKQKSYTMIPTYNSSGGVTAYVTSFAAVNRNTEYPEYAFRILDRLMAWDVQKQYQFGSGMPVYKELGSKTEKLGEHDWFLNEWNFEEYSRLCNSIDTVTFRTELDLIISTMMMDCANEPDYEKRQNIISKAYSEMQMIAGEL